MSIGKTPRAVETFRMVPDRMISGVRVTHPDHELRL